MARTHRNSNRARTFSEPRWQYNAGSTYNGVDDVRDNTTRSTAHRNTTSNGKSQFDAERQRHILANRKVCERGVPGCTVIPTALVCIDVDGKPKRLAMCSKCAANTSSNSVSTTRQAAA